MREKNLVLAGMVSKVIRRLRDKEGLTQEQLAKKAHIHVMMLSKYERGAILPSVSVLLNLADALKTSVEYILSGGTLFGHGRNKQLSILLSTLPKVTSSDLNEISKFVNLITSQSKPSTRHIRKKR
ncbi:MAG: helix-turn-helix transcriptional regulator [Caldisericia bacterium]